MKIKAQTVKNNKNNTNNTKTIFRAIIIFILILLIEVVIRQFKIVVLNMLAPIAFISYMNPNDKVLSNWFQKYVGCFLDLFIKLLALQISMLLIAEVANTDFAYGGLAKILFYIGIFIFAKTVPNLLSDVLGLKNMGGTFKDSMNALKTAALIGVGGIAGCANVYPHNMVAIYERFKAGDLEGAQAAQDAIASFRACFKYGNPNTIVKTAVGLLGYPVGKCRKPFYSMSEEGVAALKAVLEENKKNGMN